MSVRDDERPDANGDRNRRRKLALTGATGLVVVAGVGAVLLTNRTDDPAPPDLGAAPIAVTPAESTPQVAPTTIAAPSSATTASSAPTVTVVPTKSAKQPSTARAATSVTASPVDEAKVRKEVQSAREAAAKDGVPLQRPPKPMGTPIPAQTRVEKTADGTIRITTAKGDLTGQQDQLIAGDAGEPVGGARCTHKLRFAHAGPLKDMPSLLLCWRTSPQRSVVTLATSSKGKPSSASSAAVIAREWAQLG